MAEVPTLAEIAPDRAEPPGLDRRLDALGCDGQSEGASERHERGQDGLIDRVRVSGDGIRERRPVDRADARAGSRAVVARRATGVTATAVRRVDAVSPARGTSDHAGDTGGRDHPTRT